MANVNFDPWCKYRESRPFLVYVDVTVVWTPVSISFFKKEKMNEV